MRQFATSLVYFCFSFLLQGMDADAHFFDNRFYQPASNNLIFNFNVTGFNNYLLPPNISGVVNDPTDPAATIGIDLLVKENNSELDIAAYTLMADNDNDSVAGTRNILIEKYHGHAVVKIVPVGVGYSIITLTLMKEKFEKTLVINYTASNPAVVDRTVKAETKPAATFWHTGICDASDLIPLDDNFMLIGDDEKNGLYLYNRKKSGGPLKTFSYGNLLGLTDCEEGVCLETDVEAAVKSIAHKDRIYWMGSMSNGKAPKAKDRPNRNRIFATDVKGIRADVSFSFVGYYSGLRESLLHWGDDNNYKLSKAASDGRDPKEKDGFNAEGIVFAPDNTTLYIGLRAPLVPLKIRDKALIAPLLNFETWFNNGSPAGKPSFGQPVELNLDGRSIRDMVRLSNGVYIIAAGSCDGTPNSALYKWTGVATDEPVWLSAFKTTELNIEGIAGVNENGHLALNQLQLVCDDGSVVLYNDGVEAKHLGIPANKKFHSVLLKANSQVLGK